MQTAATQPSYWKPVLLGGLVAGTLDGLAAAVQFYINTGREPWTVWPPPYNFISTPAVSPGRSSAT